MFSKDSHRAAMRRVFKVPSVPVCSSVRIAFENVEVDGKIVSVQVERSSSPISSLDVDAVDFCLNNQIASGNIVNLSNVIIPLRDYSSLDSNVSKLSDYINSSLVDSES